MKNASEVRTLKAILNDIEEWRKEKHIKKTELAAAIGMTERNFRRLYTGERTFLTTDEISNLCYLMDKGSDFFMPQKEPELYGVGLKNRIETPQEKARRMVKKKCDKSAGNEKEDEVDKRLNASVLVIKNDKNVKRKVILIQQVEGLAALVEQ